jgi:preprotein translocase subunit SecG
MLRSLFTNVSPGTADVLSYAMLLVVAIFLLSGPAIAYYYWKKSKRMKEASSTGPA